MRSLASSAVKKRARRSISSRYCAAKTQLLLRELGQLAGHAQACERERRRDAARDHERPARRQALDQRIEQRRGRRFGRSVDDAVQVVEHDHAAWRVAGGQRVDQFGNGAAHAGAGIVAFLRHHRDQCFGRRAPRQVVRFERGDQAGEQALRVVVGIERGPLDARAAPPWRLDLGGGEGQGVHRPRFWRVRSPA
ncbi:MAG: hypothetical protein ABI781_16325 [Burkholderiales bacterium]